jgi:transcriptional regulator with XRE-family HTH domain
MRYNTTTDKRREVQAMKNSKSSLKNRLYEAMTIRGKKAVDLTRDLGIPKSAVSQYLSGKSQNMDSERLYTIAKYLDVDEPWLLGFDVPMERTTETKKEQSTEFDGLSENRKALIDFVMSVSDAKAEKFLRLLQSIEEVDL